MCGIGSITLAKNASPKLLPRLDYATTVLLNALDHRGGDACGVLSIRHDGRCHVVKAPLDSKAFNEGRGTIPTGTRAVAVHTRFATSGSPGWNRNNHPVTCDSTYVLHNGVIWDWRQHGTIPHGTPEVDTYLLAKAAASARQRTKGETIHAHAERVILAAAQEEGSAAVLIAFKGTPTLISAAIDGSPLYAAETAGVRITASTYDAVRKTADALGLTLPIVPYTYSKTIKKAKKGRPARTELVHSTRQDIQALKDGDVLVWHAGTHTNSHIELPQHTRYVPAWQHSSLNAPGAAYAPNDFAWSDPDGDDATYGAIANRLLNQNEDAKWHRCDVCDDWSHEDDCHHAYGGLICPDCYDEIEADAERALEITSARTIETTTPKED